MEGVNIEESEIIAEPDEPGLSFGGFIDAGFSAIENYGWYILIAGCVGYYLWCRSLSNIYQRWMERRDIDQESASNHKNPDAGNNLESARMATISKLQEKYNQQAQEYSIKQAEKEKKKKEEWLKKNSQTGGNTLRNKPPTDDFAPLTNGSAPSYRPVRRSGCSNGSCQR